MRLSLQLYTVRDHLANDFRGTLEKVREIGYEYVEGGGGATSAEEWRSTLDSIGLKVNGFHCPIDQLEKDVTGPIQDAKTLGCRFVIVPWLGDDRRGDWAAFGRQMTEIGRKIKDAGLQLTYHNHDFEFKDNGLETLYASSDPDLVQAELDVAWVSIGGGDPVEWIRRMGKRVPLVHLKDYDPTKTPQWQPAGQGVIDWDGVLAACQGAGVEFGPVELDLYDGDPLDAARISYEFFKARGLN
ncbi:MAG TPA: sugar phosphate isomerase/epimerase [Fimbriimonas sp.]|nr:sugar phosphate isomerase/epimerase [Fimbriimonas sp.]